MKRTGKACLWPSTTACTRSLPLTVSIARGRCGLGQRCIGAARTPSTTLRLARTPITSTRRRRQRSFSAACTRTWQTLIAPKRVVLSTRYRAASPTAPAPDTHSELPQTSRRHSNSSSSGARCPLGRAFQVDGAKANNSGLAERQRASRAYARDLGQRHPGGTPPPSPLSGTPIRAKSTSGLRRTRRTDGPRPERLLIGQPCVFGRDGAAQESNLPTRGAATAHRF
jgi:hypothetical protein